MTSPDLALVGDGTTIIKSGFATTITSRYNQLVTETRSGKCTSLTNYPVEIMIENTSFHARLPGYLLKHDDYIATPDWRRPN